MSLSDRRAFLLGLAALPLAGCAFQPAYGTNGRAEALRNRIRVAEPDDRNGFDFVAQMERRLGRADVPVYELRYAISTNEERLAVTRQEITTGYNLLGRVDFTVVDLRTGRLATQGTINNFATYSATANTVATRAAEDDARLRLMVMLADDITTRLIATAGRWAT